MNIDQIISDQTPIYSKNRGEIQEYRVIESMMIDVTKPIQKLDESFLKKLSNITGQYVAIHNVNDKQDNCIIPIKLFRTVWLSESNKITKELEMLKSGKPYIVEFLEKYGVLNLKHEQNSFISEIWYDGYSTPNQIWNSNFKKASFTVSPKYSVNNYSSRYGEVIETRLSINLEEDNLIEAKEKCSIRRCHSDILLENDERYTKHYTEEEWKKDKDKGFELYLSHLDSITDDNEDIFYNKKHQIYYQKSKNYIIAFIGTSYFKCEFIDKSKGKYRNVNCEVSTLKAMNDITNKKDLITLAEEIYKNNISKLDFIKFKY